jgi:hypothetical protein
VSFSLNQVHFLEGTLVGESMDLDTAILQIAAALPNVKSVEITRKASFENPAAPVFGWNIEVTLLKGRRTVNVPAWGTDLDETVAQAIDFTRSFINS